MPYQYHAIYPCGYKSGQLEGSTCVCHTCRELVSISRMPFRYQLRPCPACGANVAEADLLLSLLGPGYQVFDRPCSLPCPRCDSLTMRFIVDSHIRMKDGFNFPTVGDEIEAEIQQDGSLDIPWFPLDEAVVTHNFPDNLRPGRIRIRVDAIETVRPNNSVDSLFYRFVVKRLDLTFIGAITV